MMRRVRDWLSRGGLTMVVCLTTGGPARAEVPPGYEIIRITDDALRDGAPQINSCGVVVWMRQLDARRESAEIFTYDDATGVITGITDDDVRDTFPSINDAGTIVWARGEGRDGAAEIAMWRDGMLTILTENNYTDSAPKVNNHGHVVWNGAAGTGCSEDDIFFFNGDGIERITTNNGFSNQGPRINDRDEIAWNGFDFCQNPWVGHILMYADGDTQQINRGSQQDQSADINDSTQISWNTASLEIVIWQGGETWELTNDGLLARLNDNGDATFIRFDEARSTFDEWLWLDGVFYELTREPEWNTGGEINNSGEVTWNRGTFSQSDVMMLRRRRGEWNGDGVVDVEDFAGFFNCLSNPGVPYPDCDCRFLDFDYDRDVDLKDYAAFQLVFGGE